MALRVNISSISEADGAVDFLMVGLIWETGVRVIAAFVVVVCNPPDMSNSPSPNWFDSEQQFQRLMDPGTPQRQFMPMLYVPFLRPGSSV